MPAARRGPSPGNASDPAHAINIRPAGGSWSASIDGKLLAQSSNALFLEEAGYDPVVYFPPADVMLDRLAPSATRTHCPFKGEAYYYATADKGAADVAWYYPEAYDEVAAIEAHIAFYASRVELEHKS